MKNSKEYFKTMLKNHLPHPLSGLFKPLNHTYTKITTRWSSFWDWWRQWREL